MIEHGEPGPEEIAIAVKAVVGLLLSMDWRTEEIACLCMLIAGNVLGSLEPDERQRARESLLTVLDLNTAQHAALEKARQRGGCFGPGSGRA